MDTRMDRSVWTEVSIGSVDKEAETNEKKTSKRDIIVVDDKELLARNSERIPKNPKKVTFWRLNVWNEWETGRNALPQYLKCNNSVGKINVTLLK